MTSDRKDIRMKRTTADRLLEGLKERILQINANESYFYTIKRAVVFGSYVNNPEMDTLGDLDIGFELESRYEDDQEEFERKMEEKQRECNTSDWWTALWWPREEVLRVLKNRSGYISLHDIGSDSEAIFSKNIIELPVTPGECRLYGVTE